MSLRRTVAAPFRGRGRERLERGGFVVALSLDRDWFSPEKATRVAERALEDGLLREEDGDLVATFDPGSVSVPEEFTPDEGVFERRSVFERVLDALVAEGADKREAVAAINERQQRLGVTVEAAAVLHARQQGLDVGEVAARARSDLES